jgi:D-3-phosphoglycerate dehydrogenase
MTTVVQIEYRGSLAPYELESAALAEVGAQLTVVRGETVDEIIDELRTADVIWLEWTPHLTADVLAQLPRCGLAMRWGVGYEQIDVDAATELGIAVANAPSYCTIDVAEHALALMLAVSRQVVVRNEQMRRGEWRDSPAGQRRLAGSTVGIIGLGRIGRRAAALCSALGAHVLGFDPIVDAAPGVECVALDELLSRSDYVSMHVPSTPQTQHLIGAETLALMKDDAVLVNTSRGAVVNEAALLDALTSGGIGAAALDVFETEPLSADHPLRTLPNVVLTPHEGAFSPESMHDLRVEMCAATAQWLTTGWTPSIVNPQVREHPRLARSGR